MVTNQEIFPQNQHQYLEWIIRLLLVFATIGAYWGVQHFEFVNFDDHEYVYENPTVYTGLSMENLQWAFSQVHQANWHPVTWISHMLDSEIFGLNAGGHHVTNLVFHIINVLLLFSILAYSTRNVYASGFVAA